MTAAVDANRFRPDHERPGVVINIDEKPVGALVGFEQRTDRPSKRLVVMRHHKHRDGFTIILCGADDQVTQKSGADSGASQVIAKCKSDAVAACTVNRTFFDWNYVMTSPLVVSHHKPAATRSRAENECDFLPEGSGRFRICICWSKQRRRDRDRQTARKRRLFRSELFPIRKMLEAAAAADSEMATKHNPLWIKHEL